ncbi:siroheme decarboxylase subunit beta [Desulfotruncus alcoholivorax]|uniref:siroheme decarboxylase subunit beta n=1 Tax=Desulfotruncus alcoholivorax TaxID=265477 RepID=UPI0003FA84AF|nr:Lrp/AsnC family transcriptional regulator [Desulfotruncus alcoholivorax]
MLNKLEKQIIRELQTDIPLVPEPYRLIAEKLGISEQELMDIITKMIDRGIIRRFGAALRHQDLGFVANAMVVWEVPEAKISEVGQKMAEFKEVTHCYQRPSRPGWPYTLFTVVHGLNKDECREKAQVIAGATGIHKYELIFSTKELKKSSMKYFID